MAEHEAGEEGFHFIDEELEEGIVPDDGTAELEDLDEVGLAEARRAGEEDHNDEDQLDAEEQPDDRALHAADRPATVAESMAPDIAAETEQQRGFNVTDRTTDGPLMPSVPVAPTLSQMLTGNTPLFLVHKGAQHFGRLPELMGVVRRVTGGDLGLGVVIRLPRHRPQTAATFLANFPGAPLLLADPELWTDPASGWPDAGPPPKAAQSHSYMGAVQPHAATPDPSWISDVLDAQRAAGASVYLSATGWVGDQQARQQLSNALAWVTASRATLGPDEPMFVNLTMANGWLSNPALRAVLLHELVESSERLWYLRFYWPIVNPRYGQLRDVPTLQGYKELAVTAALEDKILVLPNSGLTGWVATALGASGFSTGIGWPEQAFAAQQHYGRQPDQPAPPRRRRYYDRTVLHTLDHDDYQALTAHAGHTNCTCRFSRELVGGPWNPATAGLHYLLRVARLQASLSGSNPRLEALRDVRRARLFADSLTGTQALSGASKPNHLEAWEQLLL